MASADREELTKSERVWLDCPGNQTWPNITRKALRIIDAHAADRAALVAQLEAARRLFDRAIAKPKAEWADDVRRYLSGHFPYAEPAAAEAEEHVETSTWTESRGREM